MLLFLLLPAPCSLLLLLPASARAAASLATPPAKGSSSAAAAESSALSKIVGRLSAAEKPNARDWAELARETVIWGSQLKTERQDVPEGPVRDALGAVELGAKLDPKTADWPKLRRELEGLLEKPEPPPEQQQQNQEQQQTQDKQKEDQQQQDQQKSDSQQNQQNQNDRDNRRQNQSENQNQKQEQQPGESAFGDMKKKEEPPPPSDTQKVGGEKRDEAPEPADPALALPMQKLEQLKAQDSPAHLFQLMEGNKKQPTKKTGKDW